MGKILVTLDVNKDHVFTTPFGLGLMDMVPEPESEDATLKEEFKWLSQNAKEDEAEHILRGALILHNLRPYIPLAQCLRTAIIWARG